MGWRHVDPSQGTLGESEGVGADGQVASPKGLEEVGAARGKEAIIGSIAGTGDSEMGEWMFGARVYNLEAAADEDATAARSCVALGSLEQRV